MSKLNTKTIDLNAENPIADQLGFESTEDLIFVISDLLRIGFDPEAGDFTPAAYDYLETYRDDITNAIQAPEGERFFEIESKMGSIKVNVDSPMTYETSDGESYGVSLAQLAPLFEDENGPGLFAARLTIDLLEEKAAALGAEPATPYIAPDLVPGS